MSRLITNISYANLYDPVTGRLLIRTFCAALLLQAPDPQLSSPGSIYASNRILGYGKGGTGIFDLMLECDHLDYTSTDTSGNVILLGDDGEAVNIGGGVDIAFADGTRIGLVNDDDSRPVRVQDITDEQLREDQYLVTRAILEYVTTPATPVVQYVDSDQARRALDNGPNAGLRRLGFNV